MPEQLVDVVTLRAPTVRPTRAPNENPAIQIGSPGACARRKSTAARASSSSPTPSRVAARRRAHAAEVEPQRGDAAADQRLRRAVDDVVVHRAAARAGAGGTRPPPRRPSSASRRIPSSCPWATGIVTRPDGERHRWHPRGTRPIISTGTRGSVPPTYRPPSPTPPRSPRPPLTRRAPCAQIIKLPVTQPCHYNRRASDGGARGRRRFSRQNRGGLDATRFAVGNGAAFGV